MEGVRVCVSVCVCMCVYAHAVVKTMVSHRSISVHFRSMTPHKSTWAVGVCTNDQSESNSAAASECTTLFPPLPCVSMCCV